MNPAPPIIRRRNSKLRNGFLIFLAIALPAAGFFIVFILPPTLVHQDTHRFFEEVKAHVNPEELRAWSARRAATEKNTPKVLWEEPPKSVLKLTEHPDVFVPDRPTSNGPYLHLVYGGGFYTYGIDVGPTNFVEGSNSVFTIHPWVPGIYFRHEGKDW